MIEPHKLDLRGSIPRPAIFLCLLLPSCYHPECLQNPERLICESISVIGYKGGAFTGSLSMGLANAAPGKIWKWITLIVLLKSITRSGLGVKNGVLKSWQSAKCSAKNATSPRLNLKTRSLSRTAHTQDIPTTSAVVLCAQRHNSIMCMPGEKRQADIETNRQNQRGRRATARSNPRRGTACTSLNVLPMTRIEKRCLVAAPAHSRLNLTPKGKTPWKRKIGFTWASSPPLLW